MSLHKIRNHKIYFKLIEFKIEIVIDYFQLENFNFTEHFYSQSNEKNSNDWFVYFPAFVKSSYGPIPLPNRNLLDKDFSYGNNCLFCLQSKLIVQNVLPSLNPHIL